MNYFTQYLDNLFKVDENTIDLQKTFNCDNLDISPIINKILPQQSNINNIYSELEFFNSNSTHKETPTFFDKINYTQTKLGSQLLKNIITTPLHNKDDIQNILINRQTVIKSITNPYDIKQQLSKLALIEHNVLGMLILDTPETQEVYKIIFFDVKCFRRLNYSETFQTLLCYFLIIFSPIYGILSPFLFMFMPYIFLRYIMKIPITFTMFWTIIKKMIIGGTGFFSTLNNMFKSDSATSLLENIINPNGGYSIKSIVIWLAKLIITFMNSQIGTYTYIGFIILSYIYGIYNSIQVSRTYNKIINMFHSRLNIISSWLKQCMQLYNLQLCFQSTEITGIRMQIDNLLQNNTIITLLEHPTFTHEPSIISNKGIIIKTFKEFLDIKHNLIFEPFCQYIAYVDMFSSISSWIYQTPTHTKTFCTYILNSNTPHIKGNDIWNICCSNPIYNNIILGNHTSTTTSHTTTPTTTPITTPTTTPEPTTTPTEPNTTPTEPNTTPTEPTTTTEPTTPEPTTHNTDIYNNMLITGANGVGKSTYIKSIIECVILGQTLGIVPAKDFEFTPFININTYLNIPDCQGKESLFQAEMTRCYEQLEMLKNAEKNNEFSFTIMDEIFVSTNYQEGMSGAYAIINQLCKFNNCLNLITTHYDIIANMNELKVNKYFFDIQEDTYFIDYKIKQGVNKKHMALKLLKQKGFSSDIINDAEYLYNKIKNNTNLQTS